MNARRMIRRVGKLSRISLAIAAVAACLLASRTLAIATAHTEYEVKAAYLYNFGRFVEWPQNSAASHENEFTICVLGHDPFGPALDATISGEKIDGKNVVARRISKVEEAAGCRVIFITPTKGGQMKGILAALGNSGVLTVSDMPMFVDDGGMVQFVMTDERVRFEINLTAARQAGLNLSSELLKVAAKVTQGPVQGE